MEIIANTFISLQLKERILKNTNSTVSGWFNYKVRKLAKLRLWVKSMEYTSGLKASGMLFFVAEKEWYSPKFVDIFYLEIEVR